MTYENIMMKPKSSRLTNFIEELCFFTLFSSFSLIFFFSLMAGPFSSCSRVLTGYEMTNEHKTPED